MSLFEKIYGDNGRKARGVLAVFVQLWYNKRMKKQRLDNKKLTDMHSHTTFSHDGRNSLKEMLTAARKAGAVFYGVSEHFDCDFCGTVRTVKDGKTVEEDTYKTAFSDADGYFETGRKLQKKYAKKITLLLGVEFGYVENKEICRLYQEIVRKFSPDFIINSVHADRGHGDYCLRTAFKTADGEKREKRDVYKSYLARVEASLDADYPYDIVGHVGYCSRYAPYDDPSMSYAEFAESYDRILEKIIQKGKILEINSSKSKEEGFVPSSDVLRRYYELGGRAVSFGSDAHFTSRLFEKREKVVAVLKEIGFTYITVPKGGERVKVEI